MKKIITYMILLVLLVFSAAGAGELTLTGLDKLTADAGTSVEDTFTITNNAAEDLNGTTFSMTEIQGPFNVVLNAAAVTFNPTSTDLIAGASENVTLTVAVPAGQPAGSYFGTLLATYNDTVFGFASFELDVNSTLGASLSANNPTIVQGASGTLQVTVQNTGNDNLYGTAYELTELTSGTDTLSSTTPLTGSNLNVDYGTSTDLVYDFDVAETQATGTYTGLLTITKGSFTENVAVSVTVTAAPIPVTELSMPSEIVLPEADANDTKQTTFTIANTGDVAFTGISLTTDAADTTLSSFPGTLAPGASVDVTVTTVIPANADTGIIKIGDIQFTSDQLTRAATLKRNVRSLLHIKKVTLKIGGTSDRISESGDTFKDEVFPNEVFTLTVEIENTFTNDEDIDIDNVEIDVVFEGVGEDGDDIDGNEEDEVDIRADDKETVTIEWDDDNVIDWDAETGDHILEITVTGTDDNDVTHTETFIVIVEVDRDNGEDFLITEAELSRDTVEQGDSFRVSVVGRSIGEDGDKDTKLIIQNSALEIDHEEEFEFGAYDDDDCDAVDEPDEGCNEFDFSRSFTVPRDANEGTYSIEVLLVYGNNEREADSKTLTLQVTEGGSFFVDDDYVSSGSEGGNDGTTTGSGQTEFIVQFADGSTSNGLTASPTRITDVTEESFQNSPIYLALLALGTLAALGGLVALGSQVFKSEGSEELSFEDEEGF